MNTLDSSCRVAFAALTPHLDAFAQRAGKSAGALFGSEAAPFASGSYTQTVADSLINAVVAAADRMASGFDQEKHESGQDETAADRRQARLPSIFGRLRFEENPPVNRPGKFEQHYPLAPMSPAGLFPQKRAEREPEGDDKAREEYAALWRQFVDGFEKMPPAHGKSWPLWLDHFDSLWLTFTQAVPSATARGARPEVSLYDHSKAAAALAVALWRWHHENGRESERDAQALKNREDYDEQKILLIQGDFFGIQDFIFAEGGETNKQAAKILRGRSFQVSLFTELATLRILERLELPSTSQIINAAGKFLIVAHNTAQVKEALNEIQREFDDWFLKQTFGLAGLGLAWQAAGGNDFCLKNEGQSRFSEVMRQLFEALEKTKSRRFDLCRQVSPLLPADFSNGGVCAWQGHLPADGRADDEGRKSCALSRDQIKIGRCLVDDKYSRLMVVREEAAGGLSGELCELPVFGYRLLFAEDKAAGGQSGHLAASGALRRYWDFTLPRNMNDPLWNGYARRYINGYVPCFSADDAAGGAQKYGPELAGEAAVNALKTFGHLACEDRALDARGRRQGQIALAAVKGDVDNLGLIFQKGLDNPQAGQRRTLAAAAALSRLMNAFFAVYLPALCAAEYPNVYTVFAGGDDFFLIGPWRTAQKLAQRMAAEFAAYAAGNPEIHFSTGLTMVKPGAPVRALAEEAENALKKAKQCQGKNAFCLFGAVVGQTEWAELEKVFDEIERLKTKYSLSAGFIYGLLSLLKMELALRNDKRLEASLWRSQLAYRTARTLDIWRPGGSRPSPQRRQEAHRDIVETLGLNGIGKYGEKFRIPLFNHLYQQR